MIRDDPRKSVQSCVLEVEIELVRETLTRAADTEHSNYHMRKGGTSFRVCEVRCWHWLFGNKIPVATELRRCGTGRRFVKCISHTCRHENRTSRGMLLA